MLTVNGMKIFYSTQVGTLREFGINNHANFKIMNGCQTTYNDVR